MGKSLTRKIIEEHLVEGEAVAGSEIALRIDQTLTQDATGTMAYLQFEAMGIPRVRTKLSVSYVDHNMLQTGFENADDHRFLQSFAARHGIYFSRPGNGICHQVHLERFSAPGETLLGSDSHTPMCGGAGMLAIGAGGLDVAMAMAGEPFRLMMPRVVRVELKGSAAAVGSGEGRHPGDAAPSDALRAASARSSSTAARASLRSACPDARPSRTWARSWAQQASIFPSDERTREYLRAQSREDAWKPLPPDADARVRRGHGAGPLGAGAADRAAVQPGHRRAGARGRGHGSRRRSSSAVARTRRTST